MRYRGVMFRSKFDEKMLFSIPFKNENGKGEITSPRSISGWDVDLSHNELMVAEFVLFDGTTPIELDEYLRKMDDEVSDENECSLYIRAVKVAAQDCGENVHDMFLEDGEQFAYGCFQKIAQASSQGLFDQRRILPQWKKAGYDKALVGEAVDLVS